MSISTRKNIGAYIASVLAHTGAVNVTAGGAGNAAAVTGAAIDLQAANLSALPFQGDQSPAGNQPLSCVVVFPIKTTLASGNTMSLAAILQTASDATNGPWTNVATKAATVVSTGVAGGGAQYPTVDFDVDLSGAKRYVQVVFTPTMGATATDTANVFPPVLILAGQAELPV